MREPAFANLLTPARFVEGDDVVDLGGLEIGGWVIECQMAIFSDSNKC